MPLFYLAVFICGALAKDKPYQVGVFQRSIVIDKGTVSEPHSDIFGNKSVTTKPVVQVNALVTTSEGDYSINPPMGAKSWFMDNLQPGDKVLFSVECYMNGHHCFFKLPNPNKPTKTIRAEGNFTPRNAHGPRTNASALCGTGKLTPEVEAEVCK
jgi:hypothetical protein